MPMWTRGLVLVGVAAFLLLAGEGAAPIVYTLVVASVVAWALVGGWWRRDRTDVTRALLAVGIGTWFVADVVWEIEAFAGWVLLDAVPHALYLPGYALMIAALWRIVRRRRGGAGAGPAIDTAIVAVAAAVAVRELTRSSFLANVLSPDWEAVWSLAWLSADLVLVGLALLLVAGRERHNASAEMLTAAAVVLLMTDVVYASVVTVGVYASGTWLDLGWLAFYVLVAEALASPSFDELPVRSVERPRRRGTARVVVTAAAILAIPVLALQQGLTDDRSLFTVALVVGVVPALLLTKYLAAGREERVAVRRARIVESRLSHLLDQSSDLVTILGADGRVIHASAAHGRILGYDPGLVGGWNPFDHIHPDDRERVLVEFAAMLEVGGIGEPVEYRFRTSDGTWKVIESIGSVVEEDGEIIAIVTSRDVTADAIVEAEQRLRAQLLAAVGQAVIATDVEGRILYWNDAAEHLYGWPAEEVVGRPIVDVTVNDATLEDAEEILETVLAGGTWSGEFDVVGRDGSVRPMYVSNSPFYDASGALAGIIGVSSDIGEVRAARETAERRARQQEVVATLGRQALTWTAMADPCEAAVQAVHAIVGSDDCGVTLCPGFSPCDAGQLARPPGASTVPIVSQTVAYGVVWVGAEAAEALDVEDLNALESIAHVVAAAVERERSRRHLEHLALHDPLTGLPNRTLFLDRIEHARASARRQRAPFAVLLLDLDGFKGINDGLGHAAGDDLLRQVAERIDAAVRPSDTVARLGGDEFAVLCQIMADEAVALTVAERIQSALDESFTVADADVFVSASIGIVVGGAETDAATMLQNADIAMYRAKEQGRDRIEAYDAELRSRAESRLETVTMLRQAIDEQTFRVHYQPIVSLTTGEIVAAEALLRLPRPGGEMLHAGAFIEIAEEIGLVGRMWRLVLAQVVLDLRGWVDAGHDDVNVCVNLSAGQLVHADLPASIAEALARHDLDPKHLTIEVTETSVMRDPDVADAVIREIRALGVGLSIDDFGTGYSSLAYLRRLPVDVLKIDRSFVSGLGASLQDGAIVAAAIDLAHTFGLQALAEGVETREQLDALRTLGCDLAQGYYWSPAVDVDELKALLDIAHVHAGIVGCSIEQPLTP